MRAERDTVRRQNDASVEKLKVFRAGLAALI